MMLCITFLASLHVIFLELVADLSGNNAPFGCCCKSRPEHRVAADASVCVCQYAIGNYSNELLLSVSHLTMDNEINAVLAFVSGQMPPWKVPT